MLDPALVSALQRAAVLSLPLLLVPSACGLALATVQALFQVQEPSVGLLARLLGLALAVGVGAGVVISAVLDATSLALVSAALAP